jgi:ABC-type multidrug transport system fused ATPase/permease subunit
VVDSRGFVTQTTPEGESYCHPTVEPYFHQFEARTSKGIIAWTVNKLSSDVYQLRFVGCPGFQPKYPVGPLRLPQVQQEPASEIVIDGSMYETRGIFGYKWLVHKGDRKIVLDDIQLYDDLCRYIEGRERNETTLKDLTHYCRRLTDKKDLFAKHSDNYHHIPRHMAVWYVQAAFYEGIQNECDAMLTMRRAHKEALGLHNRLRNNLTDMDENMFGKICKTADSIKRTTYDTANVVKSLSDSTGVTSTMKFGAQGVANGMSMFILDNMKAQSEDTALQIAQYMAEG